MNTVVSEMLYDQEANSSETDYSYAYTWEQTPVDFIYCTEDRFPKGKTFDM